MNAREQERVVKGFASYRRIEILRCLKKNPGQSIVDLADAMDVNSQTLGDHVRKLTAAGLVAQKKLRGRNILRLSLTPWGNQALRFLDRLQQK